MTPRSWLFVPGDSPAKLAKAAAAPADALILDLEDSVASARKAAARREAADFAQSVLAKAQLWLRINAVGSPTWEQDLEVALHGPFAGVVVPKTESGQTVRLVSDWLDRHAARPALGIVAIATETAAALFTLGSYAGSSPRLRGLNWGAEDLSAAVGAATAREPDGGLAPLYQLARSLCLAGAAAAEVAPLETVYPDFRDLDGLAAYAARARRDGFVGMMAIHPAQLPVINAAFSPSPEEVELATRIVELFEANPEAGALSLDGRMVDRPHLRQARRILERAAALRGETPES